MSYSYRLYKDKSKNNEKHQRYKYNELLKMTTFQLRDICIKERLIKNAIMPLTKEELIRLIMRYRGVEESLYIKDYDPEGLEALQHHLLHMEKIIEEDRTIRPPAKIVVYENLSVEVFDQYIVQSVRPLDEGNAILIDEGFNICAIFNLVKNNQDTYYLIKDKSISVCESQTKHYSLLYFEKNQSELLYDIYYGNQTHLPKHIKCFKLPILDFSIKKLLHAEMPLAIDFGTTNTTAGIYLNKEAFYLFDKNNMSNMDLKVDEVNVVQVIDKVNGATIRTPLIPSVVGIKSISDEGIEYVFGYEAIAMSKLSYVDDGICMFYDIKRWISDYERKEKVTDNRGQRRWVKRKDMMKAYLEHVIDLAKQRFKCNFRKIHISCPSKQKYKFYMLFKEILADYEIEYDNMLDEGVAVLFNTISDLIDKQRYEDGALYKALIIDCGGGTTDLSSCDFRIENNRVSYEIDIETSYANGDTDFGGNNLTYRIMQLIKVMFAYQVTKRDPKIKAGILDEFDIDLFRYVDEYGPLEIYKRLELEYKQVEAILPTRFKDYEDQSTEDYFKVKSNFYLLFELADQIKKTFFNTPDIMQILVTVNEEQETDKTMVVYDKWKLYTYMGKELTQIKDSPEIILSIYDMNTLIKADIYQIIKKFLEGFYREDKLVDYSIIKLTGQSCKVDIFRDALKEFIPGRIIQFRRTEKGHKDNYDLKLTCLKGALKYLQAKRFGYMNVTMHTDIPTLPYVISAYTHTGEDKVLIHSLDEHATTGHISRFMEQITLKLYLKDTNNHIRYEYEYENRLEDFEETTYKKITETYGDYIAQHETDNIVNKEVKFFVWAKKEQWGFCVVPVLRNEEILCIGKEMFFNFENDIWETNFFDGLK